MIANNTELGTKYGNFTITSEPFIENNQKKIEVTCDCGKKLIKYCGELKKITKCKRCLGKTYQKFNIGDKINNFTVIEYIYNPDTNRSKIKVKCDCGQENTTTSFELGRTKQCKNCYINSNIGNNHGSYKGTKYISKSFFTHTQYNAKRRNFEFSITIEDLDKIFCKQNFTCIYSKIPLTIGNNQEQTTASVDRIDSSKGYTVDNIQFVHKDINRMKTDFTEEYFLFLINEISKNQLK